MTWNWVRIPHAFSSFCRVHTKFVHFYSVLCTFSFMLFFLEPLPVVPLAGSVVLNLSMIDPAYDQAFLLAFPHQTLENPWHIDSSLEGKFTSHFCMIPLVLLAPPLTLLFFSAIAFLSPSYFSFVLLCFPLTFYFLILSALFLNHKSVCPLWLCLASSLCLNFFVFQMQLFLTGSKFIEPSIAHSDYVFQALLQTRVFLS